MMQLIYALEDHAWLYEASIIYGIIVYLIIGRLGFIRCASVGLVIALLFGIVDVSTTLTSVILRQTKIRDSLLVEAAIFVSIMWPLMFWGLPWFLRQAQTWWREDEHHVVEQQKD